MRHETKREKGEDGCVVVAVRAAIPSEEECRWWWPSDSGAERDTEKESWWVGVWSGSAATAGVTRWVCCCGSSSGVGRSLAREGKEKQGTVVCDMAEEHRQWWHWLAAVGWATLATQVMVCGG